MHENFFEVDLNSIPHYIRVKRMLKTFGTNEKFDVTLRRFEDICAIDYADL